MNEIHLLPPLPGRCPECGGNHKKGEAHDEQSAYYRMRQRRRRKREDTRREKEKGEK